MRILKLLNKKYLLIIFFCLIGINSYSEEKPVDIWNLSKEDIEKNTSENISSTEENNSQIENSDIFNSQSKKESELVSIDLVENSQNKKIIGLYDPEDYDLNINMWSNSDGDQLKKLFTKLNKMQLSNDAIEIVNISLLTNAYHPLKNISEKEFLSFKSDWLMKNSNLNLSDEYLIKDNHIASSDLKSLVLKAIKNKKGKKITVEVDTIKQLKSILGLKFNTVLLDNMNIKNLRDSVKIAKKYYETEASGNVSLKTVKAIASTGVDRISVGSITHSAPAIDFKLEI